MFRRNRGNPEKEKMQVLQSMGFSAYQAKQALAATNGNVEQAADILLTQAPPTTTTIPPPTTTPVASQDLLVTETEEQQLRRALEESRLESQKIQDRTTSAVARKAGEAAAQRAANASKRFGANGVVLKKSKERSKTSTSTAKTTDTKTSQSATFTSSKAAATQNLHPNIKLPTQMKDKTKEEQIVRCTQRLAPHFYAVDTLLQALLRIRNDPSNNKVRSIQTTSAGYTSSLKDKPGAKDFLLAINFQERYQGRTLELPSDQLDMALLFLGISALEQIRMTTEYKDAKWQDQFEKEVRRIQNGDGVKDPVEEEVKRANFIAKCPSAPAGGGALMQVNLGSETLRRRFDGDDVLQDVIHWIGGSGSAIPEKILQREWCLVDLNRYPVAPIDVEGNMDRTLQFVGCWPSGRLEIRPSSEEWKMNKIAQEKMGSSRGLGAAPSSTLN